MGSHHEEPPVQLPDGPEEEQLSDSAPAEDLELESTEKTNYTERHPEHFRQPPEHVRDFREGIDADNED